METENLTDVIKINNVEVYLKLPKRITTLDELLKLSKEEPTSIKFMKPALYSAFKSTVDGSIEAYVSIGDTVKYRKSIYIPAGEEEGLTHTVTEIELSAIGSMAVITARLTNGDMCLSNYLVKL